jgi:hypothetical protein
MEADAGSCVRDRRALLLEARHPGNKDELFYVLEGEFDVYGFFSSL